METVKKLTYILSLVFFLASPLYIPLYAQNPGESSNKVVITGQGQRLYQIITFPEVPHTLTYIVDIEQIDGENTTLVYNVRTSVNKVEVSLRAGFYRYRITAYNRMGLMEGISDWQEFTVLMGIQPSGASYQPYYSLFFEMFDPNSVLTIYGDNFYDDTEFALVAKKRNNYNWSGINLEGRSDAIIPINTEISVNTARLSFTRGSLKWGNYEIFVRNPGGLWTCFGEVRVGSVNRMDLTLSGGYSPMIVFYDFGNSIVPEMDHGVSFRLGWLPIKSKIGNLGIEAQLAQENTIGYFYPVFNLLYQNTLNERLQLNFRLGMGFGNSHHKNENNQSLDGIYFNIGSSIQYFLWKNLFLEAGLDIQYVIPFSNSVIGNYLIFRPGINIGWQFGRWADAAEVAEAAKQEQDYSVPLTKPPKAESLFSLAWAPMFNLKSFMDPYYGADSFNLAGINMRYAYLPLRWDNSKFGFRMELGIIGHSAANTPLDLMGHFAFGLYYQNSISQTWQTGLHAGINLLNNFSANNPYDSYYYPNPSIIFGFSAQRFFQNNVYLELGLDAEFIFYDFPNTIILRPSIAAGMQSNYNNEKGLRFPSAMTSSERKEKLTIINPPWHNMHQISFGWAPMIPIPFYDIVYNYTYSHSYNYNYFYPFGLVGFNFRYVFTPIQWDIHKFGFEAEISALNEIGTNSPNKTLGEITAGIRYQQVLNNNSLVNLKAAYVLTNIYHYYSITDWTHEDFAFHGFKLGASYQNYIWRNLYTEIGIDIILGNVNTFIYNSNTGHNELGKEIRSFIKPYISIGWNFGGRTRITNNTNQNEYIHEWEFNNGTITRYNGTRQSLTIPPVINRELVETIGAGAFNSKTLGAITIPEGIKVIENDAFSGCSMASVTIPSTITSIGNSAFRNNRLHGITIPPSVRFIGANAFSSNPLQTIVIGENVIMDVNAFDNNFVNFYTENNSAAGTYHYRGFQWIYRD